LGETSAVDWILPAVLVVAWLPWWAAGRHARFWFFVVGTVLSIMCVPAGIIAGNVEMSGVTCRPQDLCFSIWEVHWWLNASFGLVTCLVLIGFTLTIESVRALARRT